MVVSSKVKEQILAVRDTGLVNMFDVEGVQRVAFDNDYYELVCFIEENKKDYVKFILHGTSE